MEVLIRGLSKNFGTVKAVSDLTVSIEPGQVTAFVGPDGAGKSTTLRMILGLIHPDAGEALIGERRYRELPRPRRVVGAVLHPSGLHPGRRGLDHLRILACASGLPGSRAEEALERAGLTNAAREPIRRYSRDMRLRLVVAAALVGDPEVLILDEQPDGAELAEGAWLCQLLAGLAAQGKTVIVACPKLADVSALAGRLVVLNGGQLRFAGSFAEFCDGKDLAALEASFNGRTQTAESSPKELL
ncbi:MAG: ATP-binding cassette domain-containing protein [Streptosporangiaceae bacterium]|nr:ATP-binding cassette domain-containing protein [Streptosporangiaceae bacterium]